MAVCPSNSHLAYFVRVAEEGQISGAARALFIAQPALSQAISRLEHQLGVSLLDRHARGVTLTRAGEVLFDKAKAMLQAEVDVVAAGRSLARSHRRAIVVGFLGNPPPLIAPQLMAAFAAACPEAEVSYRELRFPTSPAAAWLADVDVALCHAPIEDPDVEAHTLWQDPRSVLLHKSHPLATCSELDLADVLDEPFLGTHPSVDATWAGFWTLDDHRGGPPGLVTHHTPANYLELVAAMTSGQAISTLPLAVAEVITAITPQLIALPLSDASPAQCVLVWREQPRNSLTSLLVETARSCSLPEYSYS